MSEIKCILCLKLPDESINIFGESGQRLDIKNIISKHFWFEPGQDDTIPKLICTSCWASLESFDKFYNQVEQAHSSHLKIKPANEAADEDFEVEANASDYRSDGYNDDLCQGIKLELDEESKYERPGSVSVDENIKFPIQDLAKCHSDKFDEDDEESDSEIPLSKLTKQLQDEKYSSESNSSFKEIDNDKSKNTNDDADAEDEKMHIHEGKWLATCFGEETTDKPISHKELDKFIKLNIMLTCEVCRIPMTDFSSLQSHFKDVHFVKAFVTCCDRKFTLRSRLVDHILKHKLPDYFACVVCSKVLSCRQNLRKHMIVHDKKYIFQCKKCDKTFYRKQLLDRHMDTHILERKFKCEDCDKLFTSKFSLGQHIYGVHKGGYKKICEQCGKVSRDQEAFVRHQLEHTNKPKPFVECPKCGIKLVDKNGLRKHIQSQHPDDTREHICNECGTITNTIFALRRHITFMHKRTRDYKCPMCEKAFKRALTLKVGIFSS